VKKLKGTALVAAALAVVCSSLPCGAQGLDRPDLTPRPEAFDSRLLIDAPRGDGRRTLGEFPKNLGRNAVGVFSGQNLLPFAIGAAAVTTASAFDHRTQNFLLGACQSCGKTGATLGGGSAIVPVVGALFAAGRFSPPGRFRAATYDFAQAMIVNGAYSGLLKYGVRRERPQRWPITTTAGESACRPTSSPRASASHASSRTATISATCWRERPSASSSGVRWGASTASSRQGSAS
jgi:hypothetical protein